MKPRFLVNFAVLSSLICPLACSATGDKGGSRTQEQTTGANGGSGSTGPGPGGLNTGGSIELGPAPGMRDPNDMRDVPVRKMTCDANGQNCTCLRLALVGTLETTANSHGTQPFVDWLNGNSGGTARVTMVKDKPTVDETFLGQYDILVMANVNGWTFSAQEKAAVEKWVREQGGGIVTLTGFASNATEAAATSQLVAFAGMGYSGTTETEWAAPKEGGTLPIYYKGGTTDLRNCLNLWSGTDDKEAANTNAIKFTPPAGAPDKLISSLDYVGAYIGWAVNAPSGSTVIAKDYKGKNMAVALEVDGKGRIFSWGDEWIILTNQWQPVGTFTDPAMDAAHPCWHPAEGTTPGFYHSVKSLYQTKQFWYNMINWVAPPSECNFTIDDPDVVK